MDFELLNSTPFVPLNFESVDEKLNHFGVVVAQGTFHIENNKYLRLSANQETLVLEDTYYGDPTRSSLRFDSALTPYKPRTDLLIEATAYSPNCKPAQSWPIKISAGPIQKSFTVTGPRHWAFRIGRERLSEIEPISKLEIRYDYAYGGIDPTDPHRVHSSNPVGQGFAKSHDNIRLCPQIIPWGEELGDARRPCETIGLGPLPPSWQPRLGRAGTFDSQWVATKAPYLPNDFSYEFYNVAPPDMTFPGFAKGNEIVQLTNLSQERELRFALPEISMITLMQFKDGRIVPGPMNLDTIHLLVEEKKALLQWRGIFPAHIPMRKIELRMSAPDRMIEA